MITIIKCQFKLLLITFGHYSKLEWAYKEKKKVLLSCFSQYYIYKPQEKKGRDPFSSENVFQINNKHCWRARKLKEAACIKLLDGAGDKLTKISAVWFSLPGKSIGAFPVNKTGIAQLVATILSTYLICA